MSVILLLLLCNEPRLAILVVRARIVTYFDKINIKASQYIKILVNTTTTRKKKIYSNCLFGCNNFGVNIFKNM